MPFRKDGVYVTPVLARFLCEQMVQIAAFLVWSEKGDGDFEARADHTLQAFADFCQREVIAQVSAQFG